MNVSVLAARGRISPQGSRNSDKVFSWYYLEVVSDLVPAGKETGFRSLHVGAHLELCLHSLCCLWQWFSSLM